MEEKFPYLFARPSFVEGAARSLDLGGTLDVYNTSPSAEEADFTAIESDWEVTGADVYSAIEKYASNENDK